MEELYSFCPICGNHNLGTENEEDMIIYYCPCCDWVSDLNFKQEK